MCSFDSACTLLFLEGNKFWKNHHPRWSTRSNDRNTAARWLWRRELPFYKKRNRAEVHLSPHPLFPAVQQRQPCPRFSEKVPEPWNRIKNAEKKKIAHSVKSVTVAGEKVIIYREACRRVQSAPLHQQSNTNHIDIAMNCTKHVVARVFFCLWRNLACVPKISSQLWFNMRRRISSWFHR